MARDSLRDAAGSLDCIAADARSEQNLVSGEGQEPGA